MKTILITGGLGYIGSSMLKYLDRSRYQIIVVDTAIYRQKFLLEPELRGVTYVNQDVRDIDSLAQYVDQADVIFPLAAIVGAPACDNSPIEARGVNLYAIEGLVGYLADSTSHKNPIVVFPNTNSGYGDTGGAVCTEETPLNALSLYGETKDKAEQVIMTYDNAVAFRLATVFGFSPRMRLDLLVNTLTLDAVQRGKIELFDDAFMRNYIHVRDICRAFEFAVDNIDRMRGHVYNLGNDKINMTKGDLTARIIAQLPTTRLSKLNKTDPDKRNYIVSSAKLYGLGWQPTIDIDDGIAELIYYYNIMTPYLDDRIRRIMTNA